MKLRRPRSGIQWAGAVLIALAVGGALFVWIAPYNIAARIPHAPGVSWLLHTYMRSAVKTWSLGSEPPVWIDLESPDLIRLGAGHFETGCAPCHGAPGRPPNPLVRGMRPEPPALEHAVGHYDAGDLYWLVRNGLKYTGMPAWSGEHRDDEPWALAAFLLRYHDLSPKAYAELAFGRSPNNPPQAAVSVGFGGSTGMHDHVWVNCARCHGEDGLGRDGTAPKLAGQSEPYLRASLAAYAKDRRQSGFMEPVAAALSSNQQAELAAHFADMPAFGVDGIATADNELRALGAELASRGDDEVPSCLACHGDGLGPPRKPIYPRIAGQSRRFLVAWLHLWRERDIGGTDHSHLMHIAAARLTDRQIDALGTFFAAGAEPP